MKKWAVLIATVNSINAAPFILWLSEGSIQSLDWTGGLDRWTGLVD